jgi:c-di-GMP-related signal transduction protein
LQINPIIVKRLTFAKKEEDIVYFFFARQAIFDKDGEIIGCELLHRSSTVNRYQQVNGDRATLELLAQIIQSNGIEGVAKGKLAFVNYTRNLLLQNIPLVMPSKTAVVEIHENVQADHQVIRACRNMSQKGYMIVLDDFIYHRDLEPLVLLADIIKIDFQKESRSKIEVAVKKLKQYRAKLLAEKVETEKEFEAASCAGFEYFQGNFFSKAEMIPGGRLLSELDQFISKCGYLLNPSEKYSEIGSRSN